MTFDEARAEFPVFERFVVVSGLDLAFPTHCRPNGTLF